VLLFFVSINEVNAASTNQIPDLNIINAQEIVAKNAAVYDVVNKKFIYAKNADEPVPMASLAKIITASVFLQLDSERSKQGNNVDKIQIIKKGNGYNQGDRELINGEFWKKENLIRYMLITSSNIAAQSLTNSLIDDEFAFALLMNKMVKDLKYKSFSFKNSSGLSIPNPNYNPKKPDLLAKETPSSIGSAKEIAILFNSIFAKIPFLGEASVVSDATFVNWSGNTHSIKNVNDSLSKIPHIIAGKTGTTDESGGNLFIIINPNQQKYAIVIMGSTIEDRYIDAIKLAIATEQFSEVFNASTSTSSIPLSTEAFAPLK
jgi:D-alanyl-D-alanine carboxypeptidase (penicillin-binding protein 5/6)